MKYSKNEQGIASLLVVIFIAIILSILVIAFVRLAISEQRSSTDDDLSTRAYFAAESGIEDAKRALRDPAAVLNGDTCAPPTGYDPVISPASEFDVEYTCLLIDNAPSNFEVYLDSANQTVQIPLVAYKADGTPAAFDEVYVRWHINDAPPNGDGTFTLRSTADTDLQDRASWIADDHPAMLMANFFAHTNAPPDFTSADFVNYLTVVDPTSLGAGPGGAFGPGHTTPGPNDGRISQANCNPATLAGDYVCEALFAFPGGPTSYNDYLRLTTLYKGTHIQIEMRQAPGVGGDRYFKDVQAVVDSTGRAGDVFRRVQARIDLIGNSILPNYAIMSAEDICKRFEVSPDVATFLASAAIPGTSCTR